MISGDLDSAMVMFFKALGERTRIQILQEISKSGELSVSEICENLNRESTGISHHLSCLKSCGLVSSKKKGRHVFYSLNGDEKISSIMSLAEKHVVETLEGIMSCLVVKEPPVS